MPNIPPWAYYLAGGIAVIAILYFASVYLGATSLLPDGVGK